MTTPVQIRHVHTQSVSDAYAGYFYVTVEVDRVHEKPWIKPLLENIANNLTAFEGSDWKHRLSMLTRAFNPQDALLLLQSEIPANGQRFIAEFFRRVPLLTRDQVNKQLNQDSTTLDVDNLMTVTFAGITFYLADQFDEGGSVRPEVVELMNIFRKSTDYSDWDIAMWWINPTGWLGGNRPCDVFKDKFETVKTAAEQEILRDEN